jgi:hypothetical protein
LNFINSVSNIASSSPHRLQKGAKANAQDPVQVVGTSSQVLSAQQALLM